MQTLNIEANIKPMIITALNGSKTHREAANKLGVTARTLYTYIKDYKIVKTNGKYTWES